MQENKPEQLAAKILGELSETIFNEESDYYISESELENNGTDFIHAIANIVPTHVYNELVADEKGPLHFNHLANQLCFQYNKIVK